MTPDVSDASKPSPWLSVWLNPRRVVEAIPAADFGWQALLLAAVYMISEFATQLIITFGMPPALPGWRIVAVVILIGAAAGIVGLYLSACFLKWAGALLGGRASMAKIRAALAWGGAPFAIGVPICLVVSLALAWSGLGKEPLFAVAVNAVLFALELWALLLILWMYARVQGFGFWRAIVSYVLCVFVLAVLIASLIRVFLFQPFN